MITQATSTPPIGGLSFSFINNLTKLNFILIGLVAILLLLLVIIVSALIIYCYYSNKRQTPIDIEVEMNRLEKNNQENEIHSVSREFVTIQLDSMAPFIKPTFCNVCQKLIHGDFRNHIKTVHKGLYEKSKLWYYNRKYERTNSL